MGKLTPPDLRAMVRDALRRIELLERRLSNLARLRVVIDVPFTLVDVVPTTSPPYYFQDPGAQVFEITVALGEAGQTDTTVSITRNDNEITSITLAAGQTFKKVRVSSDLTGNQDRVNVTVTEAGLGAFDLTVQVRAKVAY